jgi:DNA-binding response OmpR family regulator
LTTTTEIVLVLAANAPTLESLKNLLSGAGYGVVAAAGWHEAIPLLGSSTADVVVLYRNLAEAETDAALAEIKGSPLGANSRMLVVSSGDALQRARALDLGVDDVAPAPCDDNELLARVRAQLRQKRVTTELENRVRLAEESWQVAQTAFQALAVTEKMTRDAFSLERFLKVGVSALFGLAIVIAAIFFLFSHRADKEVKKAYSVIAQLEHGVKNQTQLLASAQKLRQDPANSDVLLQKEQLQQQTEDLKQKLATQNGADAQELKKQLADATSRLTRIEGQSQAAESIIRQFAPSVCLLHVSVAFNAKDTGRRLRYGGTDSDGTPLKDSDGHTVYTTEGQGPEVRADFFGTGFIAGEGKVITNHHVVQPWWENEEMAGAFKQGLEPVISEMTAYFPGSPSGISVGISEISKEADLAMVHGDFSGLQRPILKIDARKEAAVSGEALISVGYATGLDAILARAGDETVQQIVKASGGEPKLVLEELAKRKLIRPLVTQGHVGDILPDKIVYDAQTTSGGSGGPLLNREGGVIGVTFAIVRGFGGSNFGVPIRFAEPLLKH